MEQFSGADWDLEYVEAEPMGHEWGDNSTTHGSYDPFPSESHIEPAAAPAVPAAAAPSTIADAADPLGDDFGGGSQDVDPADAFFDELIDGAEPTTVEMMSDPEVEVDGLDMAEVDPFDAFDEEFALVVEEFEAELPAVEEMVEG